MLLNLSRASFWLAALAAGWSLVAPGQHETALTVAAGIAALLSFALWRTAMLANRRSFAGDAAVPQAPLLTSDSLVDAAAAIARAADESDSAATAARAVADVLRRELGARAATIRFVEAADAPGGAPDVVIDLGALAVQVDPAALASLLALARRSLLEVGAERPAVPRDRGLGRPAHVLVLEDNVVQTETTARMLRRLGCRVTVASGMLEGLDALRATQFDLVLMDTHMPGLGASEALSRLRGRPQGAFKIDSMRDTPVVAMSASGLQGDAERFRELGFDDCLFKPFRLRQLDAMLSRFTRAQAPAGEAGAPGGSFVGVAVDVLDPVALERLRDLDPQGENQLVERVLKAFQSSAARLGPQLQTAREAGDRATVRLVAHTLKSSSASIGALQLSQQCADLEAAIRNETGEDIEPRIAGMTAALGVALQAIQRVLDTQR